jgi:flavin-dependent thymidylate synthase
MKAGIKIVKPQIWNFKVVGGKDAWKEVVECARLSNVPEIIKDEIVFLMMIENDYGSILEHIGIKFDIQMTKGCVLELLEHRIASHSAASTRYSDADKMIQGKEPVYEIIMPWEYLKLPDNDSKRVSFLRSVRRDIETYEYELRELGSRRESARYVLPFAYAAGIYHYTINLRSLLNFFGLRLCVRASDEIRSIAAQLYFELLKILPNVRGLVGCRGFALSVCLENNVTGVRKGKPLSGYSPCLFRSSNSDIYIATKKEIRKGLVLQEFNLEKAVKAQEKVFKKWAAWEG